MNLAVRALMHQIEDLAHERGFERARVLSKVNPRGELVIGVLIPPRTPGEWTKPPEDVREQKRASRERR
jgi:hypothetical protein